MIFSIGFNVKYIIITIHQYLCQILFHFYFALVCASSLFDVLIIFCYMVLTFLFNGSFNIIESFFFQRALSLFCYRFQSAIRSSITSVFYVYFGKVFFYVTQVPINLFLAYEKYIILSLNSQKQSIVPQNYNIINFKQLNSKSKHSIDYSLLSNKKSHKFISQNLLLSVFYSNILMQSELKELYELFESGRYEYNVQFYDKLLKIIHNLNLYEHEESISNNKAIVSKIVELTQSHSDSLNENYDEDKAIQTTKKIHNWISKVNRSQIQKAIQQCHKMNGQSFMHKIGVLIHKGSANEKEYLEISERIVKTIHTDQLRLQNLFLVAIFMIRNQGKLKDVLPMYNKAIEKGLKVIKDNIQLIDQITHNQQLLKHPKSIAFIEGNIIMAHTLFDFYTIVKVLQGRSNVAFKLTSLKQQLQRLTNSCNNHQLKQFHEILKNVSRQIPIKQLRQVLCGSKDQENIDKIHQCCNFCLKTGTQKLSSCHQSCREILGMLTFSQ